MSQDHTISDDDILNTAYIDNILKNKNIHIYNIDGGIVQYTCFCRDWDLPIGLVWVRFRTNQKDECFVEILNCYTVHWARRKGICKYMYDNLWQSANAKYMTTNCGSNEGGKDFIENYGFKLNEELGIWIYRQLS